MDFLGGELSVVHESWLSDMSQETFLASLSLGKAGALAIGANYLNLGTLDGYDASGDASSPLHPFRGSLAFGWGGTLAHDLSVGLGGKTFYQSLTTGTESLCGSLTAGIIWRALPTLRLGAYYSFLASADSPDLGLLKIGETWSIPFLKESPTLLLFDFSLPPKGVYLIQAGVEQKILSKFFARLGYQQELRDNQIEGFRGLTVGLGVELEGFDLDYSYLPNGALGFSQMVGLTYHFAGEKPKVPKESALSFKPPSETTSLDKVVQIEVHFELPESSAANGSAVISPEIQKKLDLANQKVQANPKDPAAWVVLGNLYWQTGQPEFTVQSFEEALKLNPGNEQIRAWLDNYRKLHPTKN